MSDDEGSYYGSDHGSVDDGLEVDDYGPERTARFSMEETVEVLGCIVEIKSRCSRAYEKVFVAPKAEPNVEITMINKNDASNGTPHTTSIFIVEGIPEMPGVVAFQLYQPFAKANDPPLYLTNIMYGDEARQKVAQELAKIPGFLAEHIDLVVDYAVGRPTKQDNFEGAGFNYSPMTLQQSGVGRKPNKLQMFRLQYVAHRSSACLGVKSLFDTYWRCQWWNNTISQSPHLEEDEWWEFEDTGTTDINATTNRQKVLAAWGQSPSSAEDSNRPSYDIRPSSAFIRKENPFDRSPNFINTATSSSSPSNPFTLGIASAAAAAASSSGGSPLSTVAGKYQCTQYMYGPDENDWHHVQVIVQNCDENDGGKPQPNCWKWENKAGVSWGLSSIDGVSDELEVDSDCPYFEDGHTSCQLIRNGQGNVIALLGPHGERYDKIASADATTATSSAAFAAPAAKATTTTNDSSSPTFQFGSAAAAASGGTASFQFGSAAASSGTPFVFGKKKADDKGTSNKKNAKLESKNNNPFKSFSFAHNPSTTHFVFGKKSSDEDKDTSNNQKDAKVESKSTNPFKSFSFELNPPTTTPFVFENRKSDGAAVEDKKDQSNQD